MSHTKLNPMLLFLAAVFIFSHPVAAQQYELISSVFSNGGGVFGDSSSLQLNCAVGEPAIGEGNDSLYSLKAGFIYVAEAQKTEGLCPLMWQASLIVRDAGGHKETLSHGQGINATNDLNNGCGEAELPPIPPTGVFDARFELPISPFKSSLDDYRSDREQTINWRIRFQLGATGPMTFSWNPAEFPTGSFFLKDEITGAVVNVNMKTQSSYTLSNTVITSLKIEYRSGSEPTTRTVNVSRDWNIISVPLLAANMSVTSLFPGAASSAFAYNNGYVAAATLVNGKGYWLKFNSAASFTITGTPVTNRDIPISVGWNMIGPFESDVAVAAITSVPAGIVTSSYFGYNNGYFVATTLAVGKGYWVKASQAGTLRLPSGGANAKLIATESALFAQKTTDSWPRIVIQDSEGNTGTLYLAPQQEVNGNFERPPLPPSGIFDVRFSNNREVENLENGRHEIQINSAKFPIRIKAQGFKERILSLSAGSGEGVLNETLTEEKEIIVTAPLSEIILAENQIPERYALSQNHPNPFNPTTIIKFALPEKVHVKIAVYNTLGEKVAELVNQELAAGYHQTEFNALRYASGVYFYVMEAGAFKDLKKMLIVK